MRFFKNMQARWGVGPWRTLLILVAFSLAGMTVVRLKGPVMGLLLPNDAPTWLTWTIYLVVIMPIYQVCLLAWGTALGQFDFFWGKLKIMGRLFTGRVRRS
jgi:hypothetical protein